MKICFFNRSYWPDHGATGQLLTVNYVTRFGLSRDDLAEPEP